MPLANTKIRRMEDMKKNFNRDRSDFKNLTLEIVESRLKEIAQRHNLDLMDECILYLYTQEYGSLTNEIADILYPRYGFKGIYPTPKL